MPSLESYRPGPERVWIRYRPRNWPSAAGLWTDFGRAALGQQGRSDARLPSAPPRAASDVVYLPPVDPELEPHRRELARAWAFTGTPVLVQRRLGDGAAEAEEIAEVWDLLPTLLDRDLSPLGGLPDGAQAVWPLIPAVTDEAEVVAEGLDRLADAGVAAVQPLVLDLSAQAKRRLLESAGEGAFDRLFHGPPPAEREFAASARERGMKLFVSRPLPTGNPRLALRRRCAGELRLAAYLAYRLGWPEAESQAFLRAARWIDREDHDVAALAEEGNLEIVDWIDARSRAVVESIVESGNSPLVESLIVEFAGGTSAG